MPSQIRSFRILSSSTVEAIHLFTPSSLREQRCSSKGGKCLDAGRDAVCSERRLLKLGAPPPLAFCSPGEVPRNPEPPGALRPRCRRTLTRRVLGTRGAALRAGRPKTFCKCNLGIPGEAGTRGSGGGGGAKRESEAAASAGAGARWAEGRKGANRAAAPCCQSRGFLQSHPCYFQNLGPTVQLRGGGVRSANRWRTEWERE